MTYATRALETHDLTERDLLWITDILFCSHEDLEGRPGWGIQLNAGATSETMRTWKTKHTSHAPIHSNKANKKGWLWRPNDILGPCGPQASWHLSYRWGKTPKKPHPGNLSRPGSNPGPLFDRRAHYRLFYSGVLNKVYTISNFEFIVANRKNIIDQLIQDSECQKEF